MAHKNIKPNVEVVKDLNYFEQLTISEEGTKIQISMFDTFDLKDESNDALKATIDMLVLYKRYCGGQERKFVNMLTSMLVEKLELAEKKAAAEAEKESQA